MDSKMLKGRSKYNLKMLKPIPVTWILCLQIKNPEGQMPSILGLGAYARGQSHSTGASRPKRIIHL